MLSLLPGQVVKVESMLETRLFGMSDCPLTIEKRFIGVLLLGHLLGTVVKQKVEYRLRERFVREGQCCLLSRPSRELADNRFDYVCHFKLVEN